LIVFEKRRAHENRKTVIQSDINQAPKGAIRDLEALMLEIARAYPGENAANQIRDIPRIAAYMRLVVDRVGTNVRICDVGGGVGLFSVTCAALGMESYLLDDLSDACNLQWGDALLAAHRRYGVRVVKGDALAEFPFGGGELDVITCWHMIEHLHNSPRRMLHAAVVALGASGLFVFAAPNCVNLRKRFAVPLGFAEWGKFNDWYYEPRFRGHVREPNLRDMLSIARDLRLTSVEVLGRNFVGMQGASVVKRTIARALDFPLRLRPSLCSEIIVMGRTPQTLALSSALHPKNSS